MSEDVMSEDGHRPGDAARRALRAARDRGAEPGADGAVPAEAEQPAAPAAPDAPDGAVPERRVPRPGDAVRRALRTAAAAKGAERRDTEPAGDTGAGAPAADRPTVDHPAVDRPVGRPGDVAREALRAARAEARRVGETAAAEAAERRPNRAPHRVPAPSAAAATERTRTARDLKQFLATAFRMPNADDSEPPFESEHGPEHELPSAMATPDPPEPNASAPAPGHRTPEATRETPADTSSSAPTAPTSTPASGQRTPEATRETPADTPSSAPIASTAPTSTPAPGLADPGAPRLPRTMATPHRDTELRRTFPSLPSRASGTATGFAGTWWGNAWVRALEEGALDVKRLARGRSYAERGQVDAITVTPGAVLAYVQGSRPRPYRVQLRLRTFGEQEWERFLDAAADRPGDIAALLDKELPQALADSGVPLLPAAGELEPRCSCPDVGHPCKHAAALCYQTARLLDADPFVLLLLRGRGERDVLDALSRRNAARAARERRPESLPGVRAAEVLVDRELPPLPPPLPLPAHPEQPPVYPGVPGGPDPFALDQLATDAAARAHTLLATGHDPVGDLTLWQDAVRLAAARPGSGLTASTRALYASLADAVGRAPGDLARAVAAWRQGGPDGLAVLEEPWDPPAGRFDRARPLLLAADLPAFRPWRNHLTHPGGHVQLRLGRDGLWYAYESEPGHDDWWPRGTPDLDPVGALTGLGASDELA
ncbi:SWIM zinc finger family protein [Streptomyces sp. NPDC006654]|uniref:SWIM zinc finger family protein n=1 Tax=Streptomyces sp. NPDC006654 TaxID=3156897 RepID=UPI0033FC2018